MSDRGPAGPLALLGSAVVLVVGGFIGFQLLTASAETTAAGPTCESRTVGVDDSVTTSLVKVNVYNASRRAGLANRVSINLQRAGFLAGEIGNSQSEVETNTVTILTSDPDDPRVKLVAEQFKQKVDFAEPDIDVPADAVAIIVGDDYSDVDEDAPRDIANDREFTVCLPTVPVV